MSPPSGQGPDTQLPALPGSPVILEAHAGPLDARATSCVGVPPHVHVRGRGVGAADARIVGCVGAVDGQIPDLPGVVGVLRPVRVQAGAPMGAADQGHRPVGHWGRRRGWRRCGDRRRGHAGRGRRCGQWSRARAGTAAGQQGQGCQADEQPAARVASFHTSSPWDAFAGRSRQWLGAVPAAGVRAACQSLPLAVTVDAVRGPGERRTAPGRPVRAPSSGAGGAPGAEPAGTT